MQLTPNEETNLLETIYLILRENSDPARGTLGHISIHECGAYEYPDVWQQYNLTTRSLLHFLRSANGRTIGRFQVRQIRKVWKVDIVEVGQTMDWNQARTEIPTRFQREDVI